jgi:hypothetical protein
LRIPQVGMIIACGDNKRPTRLRAEVFKQETLNPLLLGRLGSSGGSNV